MKVSLSLKKKNLVLIEIKSKVDFSRYSSNLGAMMVSGTRLKVGIPVLMRGLSSQ
jgi:hypothetical protein